MSARPIAWAALAAITLGAACGTPPARLNAPPQGYTESPAPEQEIYTYMNDNALLADMSVAAVHFVPHTSEINSLGLRRLDRYASLLKMYGGTLRYATRLSDDELVSQRLKHVEEFLVSAGVDAKRMKLETGLPGGQGMAAEEASIARRNLMAKEEKASTGDPLQAALSGAQQSGTK